MPKIIPAQPASQSEGDPAMTAAPPIQSTLTVGQTLWYVPQYGKPHSVTIAKVGRKWATTDAKWNALRISIETLAVDSWGGHCYPSQEDWETHQRVVNLWDHVAQRLSRIVPPKHITEADIRTIADICGITLP